MFERRHYNALASMMKGSYPSRKEGMEFDYYPEPELYEHAGARDQWFRTLTHLCEALAKDNPNFDEPLFRKACGVKEEP